MRWLAPLLALCLASGCPSSADPVVPPDGGVGDGPDAGDGECVPQTECSVAFRYPAAGLGSVELHGSFDDWGAGKPMTREGDFFQTELPLADGERVEYKFVLDGTDWVEDPEADASADDGFGGKNSVKIADCNQCPESAGGFDWRDGIMYFVFVDRFFDGDPENDDPLDGVATPANYQGGDLAGVLDKLEEGYFEELGVNVLWLTAPVDNADGIGYGRDGIAYSAYHGYWPKELDKIEPRFGTLDDLRAVVDAAHERGIKVVLDYVMNHVHTESSVYRDHPDWFWPLDLPGGGQCVCGAGCDWGGDQGRRCWFEPYLADFNFTIPEARDFSVSNAIDLAQKSGIDGYRLDAVKHIETQWILDLRARLEAEVDRDQSFYLVGETFDGDRGLIGSYVDPDSMLDGQFDFPLRAQLVSVLLRREGSMQDLASFIADNDHFYHPRSVMGTFIGNHDLPRPVHTAEDAPQFGPWDSGRDRGWNNTPALPDYASPFERLAVAYTYLMTSPGMPLIYYGDEIGMAGGGDPDNRRPMQWDGLSPMQAGLRDRIETLTRVRADHAALRRGTRQILGASQDALVYAMSDGGDRVIVALNRGDGETAAVGLPDGRYTDLVSGDSITAPTNLAPRSARVLVSQ